MASVHKNLYMAIKHALGNESHIDAQLELREAMAESELYLASTKSFEYSGKIEMNGGNIIKCVDIRSDLDDIMRAINSGDRNVKRTGYICIVLDDIVKEPVAAPVPVEESMVG